MNAKSTPFLLAILDGLGNNPNPSGNAVYHAKTPVLDNLFKTAHIQNLSQVVQGLAFLKAKWEILKLDTKT
jgi:bisphosphoglycerate-independent phosphoglycerate mutase (AlkP superfamily)